MDSRAWLDKVRNNCGLTSDYQVAKLLGVTVGRVSSYRTGRTEFDEDMAARVGAALGEHPAHVLATVRAGIARTDKARAVWEEIARHFGHAAALFLAVGVVFLAPGSIMPGECAGVNITEISRFELTAHYASCLAADHRRPLLACVIFAAWLLLGRRHANHPNRAHHA